MVPARAVFVPSPAGITSGHAVLKTLSDAPRGLQAQAAALGAGMPRHTDCNMKPMPAAVSSRRTGYCAQANIAGHMWHAYKGQ